MNHLPAIAEDEPLSRLLRSARPVAELAPGFSERVWQRIERAAPLAPGVLDRLAAWILTPRYALAALAAIVVIAAAAGAVRGLHAGEAQARDRYIASVDPGYLQP